MGWASGLQSGMQLARAYKDAEERQAMEKIQGATASESEGYTEAQGRQLTGLAESGGYDIVPQYAPAAEGQTQGLFTGYQAVSKAGLQDQAGGDMPAAPQTIAPQRITEFLGQRYEGGLTPERMETIRTRAMANAVTDPRQRQQMLMNVTAEERAQEAEARAKADAAYQQEIRPLQKAALVNSNAIGNITLTEAQQRAQDSLNYTNYQKAFTQASVGMDVMQQGQLARELAPKFNLTTDQQRKIAGDIVGVGETEIKALDVYITQKFQNKDLTQVLDIYKTNPKFDDKMHYDSAIDPKTGKVTLTKVETLADGKSGKVLSAPQTFDNEALALGFLYKGAKDAGQQAEWALGVQTKQAQLAESVAGTKVKNAQVGLIGEQTGYYKRRSTLDEQESKRLSPEVVTKLNNLSIEISDLEAKNDVKGATQKFNEWNRQYTTGMATIGKVVQPKIPGKVREMTDVDTENMRSYREWIKEPRNARLPQGQKDAYAESLGILQFVNRASSGSDSGLGADLYAPDRKAPTAPAKQGIKTSAVPPALSTENTKLLGRAGNSGYSVELPDGTTRVMSIDELNKVGYQFLGGNTGLERPWYADLMPRK